MLTPPFDYLREPQRIYERSFELVAEATDLRSVPVSLRATALRIVHACAMPDVVQDLTWKGTPAENAVSAIGRKCTIFADCEMVGAGIGPWPELKAQVVCTLNDPRVPALATSLGTTRSAAAVDLWGDRLDGAVVVIGNAPTALFRLLELLHEGAPKPAAILGFPVGFVGAAESKAALATMDYPHLTLHGRRGGSAIAAAALNALAREVYA